MTRSPLPAAAVAVLLAACAPSAAQPAADAQPTSASTAATISASATATVAVRDAQGRQLGTVLMAEGPTGVLLRAELQGLPPGWHAMHFHAKGDCSDPKFQSAGGHVNHAEAAKPHGLLHPQGPDFGDLPSIHADAQGNVRAEAFTSLVSLFNTGGRPALVDADGSALVIHANADDQNTQPIGGAGDRIACGVIGR